MLFSSSIFGMLIPIPDEYIDQVFLSISYYLTALISPGSLFFVDMYPLYALSFLFLAVCLASIILNYEKRNTVTMAVLSFIPGLNILPMIRFVDWPLAALLVMIPSLLAIPINFYYIMHPEKFTDIYYDIYLIATVVFIINWAWFWCDFSYAAGKHRWIGIFTMIPIINVFALLYIAFGKGRRQTTFY